VPFATGLAWISLSTAGHTKRICVNAAVMIGYAVGNASAPFMWKAQYQPRNHVPWLVIALGSAISAALLLVIRYILATENKRRDAIIESVQPEETYIVDVNEKGEQVKVKVDRSFLDLTDGENQDFRYPL
jgi:ACS family allantoate permease-like MFS transporter